MLRQSESYFTKKKQQYDVAYAKGEPLISDASYDRFVAKFANLYPKAKTLKEVGALVGRSKNREKLDIVVGSLDLERPATLSKWMRSIEKQVPQKGWLVEPKFDGTSITLKYVDGKLVKAWSRGKIVEGESLGYDVTASLRYVQGVLSRLRKSSKSIPLKGEIDIRGELIMHRSIFKSKYFKKPMPWKPKGYQNARNLCSGLINRADAVSAKAILKDCTFIALNLFQKTPKGFFRPFDAHKEWVYLTFMGFTTAVNPVRYSDGHWKIYNLVKEGHEPLRHVLPIYDQGGTLGEYLYWDSIPFEADVIERMEKIHSIVDIDCDGIVIQPLNNKKFQLQGEHLKSHPAFMRAVKLDVHSQMTLEGVVKEIEWNVSKRGLVKPVIILKKGLDFNGVIVNRCTAINAAFILKYKIEVGTKLRMIRSGDTIPRCMQVSTNGKWIKVVTKDKK